MKRILVIRNDKIGDFILALPSFALLKASMSCRIAALVPAYTAPLAQLCPWIDEVIVDPGKKSDSQAQTELLSIVKERGFDVAICLFSNTRNALLVWRAGIPYRLAPATKLAQIFYNHRVLQRRSRSEKPEYEYNLDLIRYFLRTQNVIPSEIHTPYMRFEETLLADVRKELSCSLGVPNHARWVFVHSGTGGSATNLSLIQYAKLIKSLSILYPDWWFFLTSGPGEEANTNALYALVTGVCPNIVIYQSNKGLEHFCQVVANAQLFIAGSTGPLHIAAALDVPTVGFFPSKRSATALRWKTLNSPGRHLAFSPLRQDGDMESINIDNVTNAIVNWRILSSF